MFLKSIIIEACSWMLVGLAVTGGAVYLLMAKDMPWILAAGISALIVAAIIWIGLKTSE